MDDPQLVVDYVNEIYEYMRMMERSQAIKKDYLTGKIGKKVFVVLRLNGYRDENQCPAVSNPAFSGRMLKLTQTTLKTNCQ